MRTVLVWTLGVGLLCNGCKPEAAKDPGVVEIAVTDRGFEPARLEVRGGQPLTLRFTRKTAAACGEAVLIDGDPVEHRLPKDLPVDVHVTPPKSGTLAFQCGMHMMNGTLVAH